MSTVPQLSLADLPASRSTPPTPALSACTPSAPELHVEFKKMKSEGISHLFPILEGLQVPGKQGDNPSVTEIVEEVREEGQEVSTFPIAWRQKTPEELAQALAPMRHHYMQQVLFVRERTRRRLIENEELTTWSKLNVAFQYSTPIKHKLMAHWMKNVLEKQLQEAEEARDGEGHTTANPSSMGTSVSSYHRAETPTAASGPATPHMHAVADGGEDKKPHRSHHHRAHPQSRMTPPPAILPSRRGSLPPAPQSQRNRNSPVPRPLTSGTEPTTGGSVRPPRAPRVQTLEEAQNSVRDFEKTLTMILDNPHGPRSRRERPQRGPPQQPQPTPLAPLTLPSGGDGVHDAFQSAIKPN